MAQDNFAAFNLAIDAWVKKAGDKIDGLVRQVAFEAAERIVKATPVDTGFARASWWVSLTDPGANPTAPKKGEQGDKSGAAALSSISLQIAQAKAGGVIYLLNSAAYIQKLEYGHSKQAPNGMVRPVIAQGDALVQGVAAKLGIK